jgi:hypothetical protein
MKVEEAGANIGQNIICKGRTNLDFYPKWDRKFRN